MKRLHVANIANMAYNYAKILNQQGLDSEVLCYDLDHFLSHPSSNLGFEGLPDWYYKVRTSQLLKSARRSEHGFAEAWLSTLQTYCRDNGIDIPSASFNAYQPYVDACQDKFFRQCDVIYGYAYGAIPPFLYAEKKSIPIDLGSLRGLGAKSDDFSKLLAASLKAAPCVILTNPDVRPDCAALGIDHYVFIPHPIDEEQWAVPLGEADGFSNSLKRDLDADFVVIAPARHDWAVKGSDEIIRGVVSFARAVSAKVRCILVRWGNECERSRNLIAELGASDVFVWKELLSELELKRLYAQGDALVDQVGEAVTFGLTTPKAMAAGIPVLTCFDRRGHDWCYAETPPLIDITDRQTLCKALVKLHGNPVYAKQVVRDQRDWMYSFHSKAVVASKFIEIENTYLSSHASCRVFYRLQQKKSDVAEGLYRAQWLANLRTDSIETWAAEGLARRLLNCIGKDQRHRTLYVGCGGGLFPFLEGVISSDSCAIDSSSDVIETARERYPDVEFKLADVDGIPYADGFFDLVVMGVQFSSRPDIEIILGHVSRVMKCGGRLVFQLPYHENPWLRENYPKFLRAWEMLGRNWEMNSASSSRCCSPTLGRAGLFLAQSVSADASNADASVSILARHFMVSEILSGSIVSGLFSRELPMNPLISDLDRVLIDAPHPAACIVCEASSKIGISVAVKDYLDSSGKRLEGRISVENFDLLIKGRDRSSKGDYVAAVGRLLKQAKLAEPSSFFDGWPEVSILNDRLQVRGRNWTSHPLVMIKRLSYRFFGMISAGRIRPFFIWDQKHNSGNKLFDLGKINCQTERIDVEEIINALRLFREYGLACIEIPGNTIIIGLAEATSEAISELSSYRVLAYDMAEDLHRIVVSRWYYDLGDVNEVIAEAAPEFEIDANDFNGLVRAGSANENNSKVKDFYRFLGGLCS